ncbi:MAG: T9SS type A sorting domain-containing protein [Bacteroidota bacterium]|nr:T9SS type A sorting domain-containing protein [Bacteroidota bacterium]MDP4212679.1 T9SS type A sorting domain-containing protein [Bacteroidota bacterium]MDP4250142.1 T9SS type A sorting domain-containing protein [Bacteroidota bacterium]
MKSSYSTPKFFFWQAFLIWSLLILTTASGVHAQNLVVNSNFTGGSSTGWSTSSSIEINPQSVYGGTSSTAYATELDVERTINQKVCILSGLSYTLTFQASRRTGGGTPANPGLQVIVTGTGSNTNYVNDRKAYTNTSWSAQNMSFTFSVPSNSSDKLVNIQFLSNNNSGTYGVLVWDIELAPASTNALSVSGPVDVSLSSPADFAVTNAPSGATYSWTFPDANASTSTRSRPSGISWSSLGVKTVSTALSNGTCTMASYSKAVTVVVVLPVQWTNFDGSVINHNAHLTWIAQDESEGRYFVIQRSANSVDFDSVGMIASLNMGSAHTYSFTDGNTPSGQVSYRLLHVDLDNNVEYSSIVSLNNDPVSVPGAMGIFPNPAISTLTCTMNSENEARASIRVFNLAGLLMMSTEFHLNIGLNQTTVNISSLRPGTYFLNTINAQTGAQTVRAFVKG